jgi:hypothetical protein
MKNLFMAIALFPFALISCSKKEAEAPLISETATVSVTKYPCGPACTADAWLLIIAGNTSYEAVNLPDTYKISNLPVQVTLKKTGLRSVLLEGTVEEKVEVIAITKR